MDDGSLWAAVGRMYDRDEVVAAQELAESLGTGEFGAHLGFYRSIEAEAATRRESRIVRLAEWLEFEYLPHEVRNYKALAEATLATCDLVAERLGWTHGAATRIAVLADEADAPWATNPHGYHSPRTEYDKICLPAYLQDDLGEFRQAIAHEYAHVVTHHLTEGRAPRWLSEAVSVLAERNFDARALKALAAGKWRAPGPLEAAFAGDEEGENPEWDVWLAYQQSGWIGRFLVSLGDERRLGDLLRAHVGGSTWGRVLALLQGRSPTDRALRQTYGLTVADLFEQARANL